MGNIPIYVYQRPQSFEELAELLAEMEPVPAFLAGGTDLWVNAQGGKKQYPRVIDLKSLPGLTNIELTEQGDLKIGSLVNMSTIEKNSLICQYAMALAEAAGQVGSYQIRNRATVGGNIGNGAPTADTAIALLALEAEVHTWSPQGTRIIPIHEFWLNAGKTCLANNEVITQIKIPVNKKSKSVFIKQGPRQAMDIAIVNVAVKLRLEGDRLADVCIALGGAGSTPLRAKEAEEYLRGKAPEKKYLQDAGVLAADESNPRSSSRASREYRLDLIAVLVERALQKAAVAMEGSVC